MPRKANRPESLEDVSANEATIHPTTLLRALHLAPDKHPEVTAMAEVIPRHYADERPRKTDWCRKRRLNPVQAAEAIAMLYRGR